MIMQSKKAVTQIKSAPQDVKDLLKQCRELYDITAQEQTPEYIEVATKLNVLCDMHNLTSLKKAI